MQELMCQNGTKHGPREIRQDIDVTVSGYDHSVSGTHVMVCESPHGIIVDVRYPFKCFLVHQCDRDVCGQIPDEISF